jgi:hypothetical protein
LGFKYKLKKNEKTKNQHKNKEKMYQAFMGRSPTSLLQSCWVVRHLCTRQMMVKCEAKGQLRFNKKKRRTFLFF